MHTQWFMTNKTQKKKKTQTSRSVSFMSSGWREKIWPPLIWRDATVLVLRGVLLARSKPIWVSVLELIVPRIMMNILIRILLLNRCRLGDENTVDIWRAAIRIWILSWLGARFQRHRSGNRGGSIMRVNRTLRRYRQIVRWFDFPHVGHLFWFVSPFVVT